MSVPSLSGNSSSSNQSEAPSAGAKEKSWWQSAVDFVKERPSPPPAPAPTCTVEENGTQRQLQLGERTTMSQHVFDTEHDLKLILNAPKLTAAGDYFPAHPEVDVQRTFECLPVMREASSWRDKLPFFSPAEPISAEMVPVQYGITTGAHMFRVVKDGSVFYGRESGLKQREDAGAASVSPTVESAQEQTQRDGLARLDLPVNSDVQLSLGADSSSQASDGQEVYIRRGLFYVRDGQVTSAGATIKTQASDRGVELEIYPQRTDHNEGLELKIRRYYDEHGR